MTYSAEINRTNPACLLLLLDQSYSMSEEWTSAGSAKAQALTFSVNRLLTNAIMLCTKGAGRVYDYFEVGLIGYGGRGVAPVLAGTSHSRPLVPISEIADSPLRVDVVPRKVSDGAGGLVETNFRMPVWLDPVSDGGTPMVHALEEAADVIERWSAEHRNSFPAIVVNITDGESTDGNPRNAAARLRTTSVADGSTLLFNLHLSSQQFNQISLPSTADGLPGGSALDLFEMSSVLPEALAVAAAGAGFSVNPGARGFMFNADASSLVNFLNLGTRAVVPSGLKEIQGGPDQV